MPYSWQVVELGFKDGPVGPIRTWRFCRQLLMILSPREDSRTQQIMCPSPLISWTHGRDQNSGFLPPHLECATPRSLPKPLAYGINDYKWGLICIHLQLTGGFTLSLLHTSQKHILMHIPSSFQGSVLSLRLAPWPWETRIISPVCEHIRTRLQWRPQSTPVEQW